MKPIGVTASKSWKIIGGGRGFKITIEIDRKKIRRSVDHQGCYNWANDLYSMFESIITKISRGLER